MTDWLRWGIEMKPAGSRIIVKKLGRDAVIIEIPPRGIGTDTLFLGLWLFGWCAGLVFALIEFVRQPRIFLLIWLVGGGFAAIMALYLFLWPIFGREFLGVGKNAIVQVKRIFGIVRKRAFEIDDVDELTIVRGPATFRGADQLAIRYRGKYVELAHFASDDERRWLLEEMEKVLEGDVGS